MDAAAPTAVDAPASGKLAQIRPGEDDSLIKKDDAPPPPSSLRRFFSHRLFMLLESSAFGASAITAALPWILGNRVCDTSLFAFGSPLSIAAFVGMPVSILCYVGSDYLRPSENQLNSDEENELDRRPAGIAPAPFEPLFIEQFLNRDLEFTREDGEKNDFKYEAPIKAQFLNRDLEFTREDGKPTDLKHDNVIYHDYTGRPPPPIPLKSETDS